MIDLHTHSLFSDGELLPSELARRAEAAGYEYLGISDHVDVSNLDFVVPRILKAAEQFNQLGGIVVLPGVELTHVPPRFYAELTDKARALGAKYVVSHGESPVEPVAPGTNLAAIEAGVDILAHPGLITEKEAALAAEKGVLLEITARKGHCLGNGRVAQMARLTGAGMVLNTDAHGPGDLISDRLARIVALGAGLDEEEFRQLSVRAMALIRKMGLARS